MNLWYQDEGGVAHGTFSVFRQHRTLRPTSFHGINAYLSDFNPELRVLDIGRGFVKASEEFHRRLSVTRFSCSIQLREHPDDIGLLGEFGRVRRWPDQPEVVPKSIVAGVLCDSLFDGNLLRNRAVGDANVDVAAFQIVDSFGGVSLIPTDAEVIWCFRSDELVGKCYGSIGSI